MNSTTPDIPRMATIILGTSNAGKTTFVMASYATMAGGLVNGLSLHCRDRARGLGLLRSWDTFAEEGELPVPTRHGELALYPFVFKSGVEPWLEFDLLDYRGGAVLDDPDEPDVQQLLAHLVRSTSIYLAIDSAYLTAPVDASNRDRVLRRTGVRQISELLHDCFERCQAEGRPLPSLVLLLTKSDLMRPRFAGRAPATVLKELLDNLRQVVPLAFAPGVSALVCPVRIARFCQIAADEWQVESLDPMNLHRPVAFSLLHHIQLRASAHRGQVALLRGEREEKQQRASVEASRLRSTIFGGYFNRDRLARDTGLVTQADERLAAADAQLRVTERQIDELLKLLASVPVLQDGEVVNLDLSDADGEDGPGAW